MNPFSWGNVTNNIFLEAPAGVGYSYCDTAAGCVHTDTAQAVDNLAALKDFFSKFPELQKNDFWVRRRSSRRAAAPACSARSPPPLLPLPT